MENCSDKDKRSASATKAEILEPFTYIAQVPGKGLWQKMLLAFNHWIKAPGGDFNLISEVIAMIHDATLIIDDIQDGSETRRGKIAAHCKFGTPLSINAANYVYFLALRKLERLQNPKAFEVYTQNMISLHEGQGYEIYYRDNRIYPTQSDYEGLMSQKTSGLIQMAAELLEVCGPSTKPNGKYSSFAKSLGICFQIRDDYMNLKSQKYHDLKGVAEDLDEKKFSFPIIQALTRNTNGEGSTELINELSSLFWKDKKTLEDKHKIIHILNVSGAISKTLERLNQILDSLDTELKLLGSNDYFQQLLDSWRIQEN